MVSRYKILANQGAISSKDGRVKMVYDLNINSNFGFAKMDFYQDNSTLLDSINLKAELFDSYFEDIKYGIRNRTYGEIIPWIRNIEFYINLDQFCMSRRLPKFSFRSLLRCSSNKTDRLQDELFMAFIRVYAVAKNVGLQNILQYNVYNILSECEKARASGITIKLPYNLISKSVSVKNENISVSLSMDDIIGFYLSIGKRLSLKIDILRRGLKNYTGSISMPMLQDIRKHLMLLGRCIYIPIQDNILEEWRNIFLVSKKFKLDSSVLKEVMKDGRDSK